MGCARFSLSFRLSLFSFLVAAARVEWRPEREGRTSSR